MKTKRKSAKRLKRRATVLLILAAALLALSLAAPLLMPNDPDATDAQSMNLPPDAEHPLGTDRYGRCVLSRVLAGAETSIFSAVALVLITFLIGTALGMAAG